MKTSRIVLAISLMMAFECGATPRLDLISKNPQQRKGPTYSVEITEEDSALTVKVRQAQDGNNQLIYEASGLKQSKAGKTDIFSDDRMKLTVNEDGSAHLDLNNGTRITDELF